jgi:hypothetical protein
MSVVIGTDNFSGPFTSPSFTEDRSGVYVVLDSYAGKYWVLDCGESATVRTRLMNHDRANCWLHNRRGSLVYAVLYTPGVASAGRVAIEQRIRARYKPSCGVR